jgi:hypothetical protein
MKQQTLRTDAEPNRQTAELDLVVPFTTPELTRTALQAAERLGAGLNGAIRLLKVQVVPFPMQQSPVHLGFLKKQLALFQSALPLSAHIVLGREYEPDLMRALRPDSIVILASKKRLWRTHTESMAAKLRHSGHRVVLVYTDKEAKEKNNA